MYEEQLKSLFKDSHDVLQLARSSELKKPGGILSKISGSSVDVRSPLSGSLSSLSPGRGGGIASQSIADFGVNPSFSATSQDLSRAQTYACQKGARRFIESCVFIRFDKIFPFALEQIQPVCVAEQKFLNSFFHFERAEVVSDGAETDEESGSSKAKNATLVNRGSDTGSQNLLDQLFSALLQEIEYFIDFGEKQDS